MPMVGFFMGNLNVLCGQRGNMGHMHGQCLWACSTMYRLVFSFTTIASTTTTTNVKSNCAKLCVTSSQPLDCYSIDLLRRIPMPSQFGTMMKIPFPQADNAREY